jgi:hypothetical protein
MRGIVQYSVNKARPRGKVMGWRRIVVIHETEAANLLFISTCDWKQNDSVQSNGLNALTLITQRLEIPEAYTSTLIATGSEALGL